MLWGEAQSVIQLAAALNTIYLSLGELRNPFVRNERELMLSQINRVQELYKKLPATQTDLRNEGVALNKKVLGNQISFQTKLHWFGRADAFLGPICAILVVLYVILLIVSAYRYKDEFWPEPWTFILNVAGYLPIGVAVVSNMALVINLKYSVTGKRLALDEEFLAWNARAAPHLQK